MRATSKGRPTKGSAKKGAVGRRGEGACRLEAPGRARSRLAAGDRRRQLLESALALANERGHDAVTLASVAEAAGVTRPIAYRHFESRAGLMLALLECYGGELLRRIEEAEAAHPDFEAAVREASLRYLETLRERGSAAGSLLAHQGSAPEIEAARLGLRRRHLGLWARRLRRETGRTPLECRAIAGMFLASMQALAEQYLRGQLSRSQAVELQTEALVALVRNGTAP